jgi:tetratricopeptide (TPR) repeat protein
MRAWAYKQKGYYDKAIADYTEAIRLDPNLTDAYRARSVLYIARGDTAHAEADIAEAKRLETTRR